MIAALLAASLAAAPTLTLEDALARAKHHPRVLQATGAVDQAAARVNEARATWLPSASAQAGYTRATGNYAPSAGLNLKVPQPETNDSFPLYSASVNASQLIWDFGRTSGQVEAARRGADAARGDAESTELDVRLAVKTAYFAALAAQELLKVAADTQTQMEKHLAQAKASVEVGSRPRFDVTKAQVDLTNALITRLQAENGLATARAGLSNAIGEPIGDAVLAQPAAEGARANPDPTVDQALSAALSGRPELAALDRRIVAQEAVVSATEAAYYPSFGVNGQLNWRGSDWPLVHNWQVGATLTVPLLAGGGDAARVEEQRAALEQLRRGRDTLVLQVRLDVESATLAVTEAKARRDASALLVTQASENLELAEGRYRAGAGSIIELADAQAALTSARAQAVRAGYDVATARAKVARSLGIP